MNNHEMIERLKNVGIAFEAGLRNEEIEKAQAVFGFRFPSEIRSFLACGLPIGDRFFNWRDLSPTNIGRFNSFNQSVDRAFQFDLENNADDLSALLGDRLSEIAGNESFSEAVFGFLHRSTKLIPFYAHRCFFDGMDHMPIVSFWQPMDSIFYGETFEDYLEIEFLGKDHCINSIPERMRETGIWYYLIE